MKIQVDDRFIFFIFEDKNEEMFLKKFFTYEDFSKAITIRGFDEKKIKKVCFIKKVKGYSFVNSGFLVELLLFCKEKDIKITEIKDKRTKFPHQQKEYIDEEIAKYFPFDYNEHQIKALKRMLKANNGIIKIPTAGGKGDIFISYIKEIKLPTLILVDKITLADQIAARAKEAGIEEVGIWHSKKKVFGRVVVSTIHSVKSLPSFSEFKVLILDEIHKCSANTYQEFLQSTNFPLRFGFSATPQKEDEYNFALIRQFIGSVIYEIRAEILMENEVICRPEIIFHKVKCKKTLDWQSAYEECIIKNEERNLKIVELIEKYNIPTLVLIRDVKHKQGEFLKDFIENSSKKRVEYIHGTSKNKNEAIEKLENNEIEVLISTNILNEGVNIKNVRLLINASGLKAKTETLQKLGRGMRVMEDKKSVILIDFYDYGNRFTESHSVKRKYLYKKEGYTNIKVV